MWRKTKCAAGGILLACAAAYGVSALGHQPRDAALDLSWIYGKSTSKSDRLPLSSAPAGHDAMAFNVPAAATTVAVRMQRDKWIADRGLWDHGTLPDTDSMIIEDGVDAGVIGAVEFAPPRIEESALDLPILNSPDAGRAVPRNPVRDVSENELREEDAVRARNLPEGCEPSFSPVTVPALAHVAARCMS